MHRLQALIRAIAVPALLGFCVSGCALGRSVIDVSVPAPTNVSDNSTHIVKIIEVRDLRHFEVNPNDPSQPSLSKAEEIVDSKITSHAIGRKRGGYGNALGDLALPENKTVASVIKDATRTAFQERGYKVVDEGSPDYGRAIPIAVDVGQFWAWMRPGFVELTLSLESQVTLQGKDVIDSDSALVVGHYSIGTGAALGSEWVKTIQAGLGDLIQKMELKIKPQNGAGTAAPQTSAAPTGAGS